jgi:hypothetical protein
MLSMNPFQFLPGLLGEAARIEKSWIENIGWHSRWVAASAPEPQVSSKKEKSHVRSSSSRRK